MALLVLEILRAGWPPRRLARALSSLPRRHRAPAFVAARQVAKAVRKGAAWEALLPEAMLYVDAYAYVR
eukprot:11264901-Alexandrium_andersonii.AAC.1